MAKSGKKKRKGAAALAKLAAALEGVPASRWAPIEREMLALERRASYGGAKRGPKPKLGEAMTAAILVKCTPALRDEMAAAAKRLSLGSIPEYLRELHSRFVKSEGAAAKPRNPA